MNQQSHIAQELYNHDRDRFWLSLFAPESVRDAVVAIYALDMELHHIHGMVREEMIGHIRYAWWDETLTALKSGTPRHGHPLLEALAPLIANGLDPLPLVELYRVAYPEPPKDADALIDQWIATVLPLKSQSRFAKAKRAIESHRMRYGAGRNLWLNLKLLFI